MPLPSREHGQFCFLAKDGCGIIINQTHHLLATTTIERMWGMRTKTIPVVMGVLGLVKKGMEKVHQ